MPLRRRSPAGLASDSRVRCRYGSPEVLDQWLEAVVADASELTDTKVSVGDLTPTLISPD